MFETWFDVVHFGAAGLTGGLIYWAARQQGSVFATIWRRLVKR